MQLFVDPHSGVPVYKQLMQQIERGIAVGMFKPKTRLPTVREVALDLTINPNTVARAYRELESKGIITSTQGRGTFVADHVSATLNDKEKVFKKLLQGVLQEGRQIGLHSKEMEQIFKEIIEDI